MDNSPMCEIPSRKDTSPFFEMALNVYILNRYDEVLRLQHQSSSQSFEEFFQGVLQCLKQTKREVRDVNAIR